MNDPGVRAVLIKQPWRGGYELIIGGGRFRATGIEDGRIAYEPCDPGAEHEPLLTLSREELEAVAKAILAEERPEDATVEALKDARATRDRLLAMFEARGIR